MHIAFRVDSSTIIGYGHVMRCLTLAHAFAREYTEQHSLNLHQSTSNLSINDKPLRISFICRDHPGNINKRILDEKYSLLALPALEQARNTTEITTNSTPITTESSSWLGTSAAQDVQSCIAYLKDLPRIDLLVVDHYAIDGQWQQLLKPYYQQLLVIDDLANRQHICDFLLDQTFKCSPHSYSLLIPAHTHLLLGECYILLRDEFSTLKNSALLRRKSYANTENQASQNITHQVIPTNILISMGGTDPDNLSELALYAIEQLNTQSSHISATLVISSQSIHLSSLTIFCLQRSWLTLIIDSQNMADLMLSADIAIGACGGTAWERCCLGLPCLTSINAENQQLIATRLSAEKAIINLGWHKDITVDHIYSTLHSLLNDKERYKTISDAGFTVCDGMGAKRVAKTVLAKLLPMTDNSTSPITYRKATDKDCQLIYSWQTNTAIRKHFINPSTPDWEEHCQWYNTCMLDPHRRLYLLDANLTNTVGLLRLDRVTISDHTTDTYEISIIIAPEYQGLGYAVHALKQLITLEETAVYLATIVADNAASHKAFYLAGFNKIATSSTTATYQLTVINFKPLTTQNHATSK